MRHNIVKVAVDPLGVAKWMHDSFENAMTKFTINNRTDVQKAGVNLFLTITESQNYQTLLRGEGNR